MAHDYYYDPYYDPYWEPSKYDAVRRHRIELRRRVMAELTAARAQLDKAKRELEEAQRRYDRIAYIANA